LRFGCGRGTRRGARRKRERRRRRRRRKSRGGGRGTAIFFSLRELSPAQHVDTTLLIAHL
jgi:hypothetical protein